MTPICVRNSTNPFLPKSIETIDYMDKCFNSISTLPPAPTTFFSKFAPIGTGILSNMMALQGMNAVQALLPEKLAKAYSYARIPLTIFGGPTYNSALAMIGTIDFAVRAGIKIFEHYVFESALNDIQF